MSTYTQDITHLIGKINTNLPDNDTQAITAARIRDAMGAVAYNYDLYVLKTQLNQELGSYVSQDDLQSALEPYVLKTDLDTAGYVTTTSLQSALEPYVTQSQLSESSYVTASQLEGLVTDQELQEGMQSVHDDAYAYVVEKINEIPGVDLSSYVTKSQLSQELGSYVTKTELSSMGYVTESSLGDYVTESQLQQAGYATETYVADYVATHSGPIDLSAYVTKDELSAAGYLTAVPSEYVTESQLQSTLTAYITDTELSSMGYITEAALGDYITENELSNVLSTASYVTQNELSNAGYINTQYLEQASYVTQQALSTMGYITSSALPTMSDYVSKTELSQAGYLTSIPNNYATYDAISQIGYITSSALSGLATEQYVNTAVSGLATEQYVDTAVGAITVPTKTSDLTNDSGFITATSLNGLATETYVADYVSQYAPTPDLSAYVSKTELSSMGYLTAVPSEYVTETELSSMGYATQQLVNDTATLMQQTLTVAKILYTNPSTGDLEVNEMASEQFVIDYVAQYAPTPDLSSYVTKTELSNAGYLTAVPSEYVTESQLQSTLTAYITETELSNMGYITSSDIPAIPVIDENLIPNTTATYTLGDSTHFYDATYANNWNLPNNGGFIKVNNNNRVLITSTSMRPSTNNYYSLGTSTNQWSYTYSAYFIENGTNISEIYATKTELTSKQDTLVSGTNIKTINNESLLGSGNIDIQAGGTPDYSHVLTFTAEQANSSVTLNRVGSDSSLANAVLKYSTDGGANWTDYTLGTSIALAAIGDSVMLKGTNTTLGVSTSNYHQFAMTGKIKASGDVTSLFNETGGDMTMPANCCYNMFNSCTSLTVAPKLPSTTINQTCYASMFNGCTSLTTAPELPATTLATWCYSSMFFGCTSLTTAPELPATTLAGWCYASMFFGCTSLTTAPELPATTLATWCYSSMFRNCSSLTKAPELPATALQTYCYGSMFVGCTLLTTAPVLPATTLQQYCYQYMFDGCTHLKYVKAMFTTTPINTYTENWLNNVSSTGTFVKNNAASWTTTGTNGVPSGWTVYKTVSIDTDDFPESYVEDNGKGLQVVNGAWQKVSGLLTSANLVYDSTTNTLTINV